MSTGYSNWQAGQPTRLSGCVVMLGDVRKTNDNGKWFVYNCDSKHYAVVCQIEQTGENDFSCILSLGKKYINISMRFQNITAESLLTECCTSVIISSDAQSAFPFMGKYEKHSLDANGRIVFKQENGNKYLYVNANEHWIVSFHNIGTDYQRIR